MQVPARPSTRHSRNFYKTTASLRGRGRIGMLLSQRRNIARVAKLADALDLGSSGRKPLGVRLPPLAPISKYRRGLTRHTVEVY